MADLSKLKEELGKLTVLEVAELVKDLEEEWGVSAAPAAGAVMMAPAGGDGGGEAAEEKTDFDIVLESFGDNKIAVIKEVRGAVPGLGLADAKKLVEGAPSTLREAAPKEEAEEIKKKLEEAGAKVTLK